MRLHAVEGGVGEGGAVEGDAEVVVGVGGGVAAALEVDGEPCGGARVTTEAREKG